MSSFRSPGTLSRWRARCWDFLVFNFPPARIYLGDGGAYLIGFCIAALSLASSNKGSIAAVMLVTVVGLGVPILDTTFALVRRGRAGVPAVSCG